MAFEGRYQGVEIRPGTPLDKLCMMTQARMDRARVRETLAIVHAAAGSDKAGEKARDFLAAMYPEIDAQDETQREAMEHLIGDWGHQEDRFAAGIIPGLIAFKEKREQERKRGR